MQKLASRKLRLGSSRIMQIAEKLYNMGYLSYPRTETNIFSPSLNVLAIAQELTKNKIWGSFAQNICEGDCF